MTSVSSRQPPFMSYEARIIQSVSVYAGVVAIIAAVVDAGRGEGPTLWMGLTLFVGFLMIRFFLPINAFGAARLFAFRAATAAVLALAGALGLMRDVSAFSVWAGAWALIPAVICVYHAFNGRFSGSVSGTQRSAGYQRYRKDWPRFRRLGAHVFLLHVSALSVLPILWIADAALSPGNILGGRVFDSVSLEHFVDMLGDEEFWIWSRNSVIVATGTTIVGLALSIPAAFGFSRYKFRGRRTLMLSFLLAHMVPGAILLVPYFLVMKTMGLLNTSLGLIFMYSVTALPICVWLLKGAFDAIPRDLEEAATLDGCSAAQVFWTILLPLSAPTIAVAGLFSFVLAWNEFLFALVFNTANDVVTLPVGLSSLISGTHQRWGDFAAASFIVSIPTAALLLLFQKSIARGIPSTADSI